MSTPASHRWRRVPAARTAPSATRAPVDWVKVGRRAVRRRARAMTHTEAAAALDNAKFDRRQDLRHEESADDGGRSEAEFAEWERITQLLVTTGGAYDPDAYAVVQGELGGGPGFPARMRTVITGGDCAGAAGPVTGGVAANPHPCCTPCCTVGLWHRNL